MQKIRAKKSLGQNFLIDIESLIDISSAVEISEKNIVEVGPGYGALTDFLLAENPSKIHLVELDTDMITILNKKMQNEWKDFSSKITIFHKDVLKFSPEFQTYSLIANIPYYITSPILFHFLYAENFAIPDEMVILMQKEVGEKILTKNNSKKIQYSYLSLAMHLACENIEMIRIVPSEAFDPAPKVDSIVLKFLPRKNRNLEFEKKLLNFWNKCFKHPRKTLVFNLKSANIFSEKILQKIESLGYSPAVRAEAIRLEDWSEILSQTENS